MAVFSVTQAIISWLTSLGWDATGREPSNIPDELVTVQRTGGEVRSLVDHPTIAIQCWATTEKRAEEMANAIRAEILMRRPPAGIHSMRVNAGPYPFFDPTTRRPRFQLVLDVSAQIMTRD